MFQSYLRSKNHSSFAEQQVGVFLSCLEDEQLEILRDGGTLQREGVKTTNEAPSEGLPQLNIDKHHFDTSLYRNKALVRVDPEEGRTIGLATGRVFDDDGELLKGALERTNRHEYKNLFQGRFYHAKGRPPNTIRAVMSYDMGCDMLPSPVQPFIMKRNSPLLQRAINNNKTPKHVRRFLNRNTTRVDGLRYKPMGRQNDINPVMRHTLRGRRTLSAVLHSALLQKKWRIASRAYAMMIRCREFSRESLMGIGIQILTETRHSNVVSACSRFLSLVMLEMPWMKLWNRSYTQGYVICSKSDDFFRHLAILHLKYGGAPQDLLVRLEEEMMTPPISTDPVLVYIRAVVLLRCVYQNIEDLGMVTTPAKQWLQRAGSDFKFASAQGVKFDLEDYLNILDDVLTGNVHGEAVKHEGPLLPLPCQEVEEEAGDSDDAVPWWETLNSGGEDDDEIIVDDESDTEIKSEPEATPAPSVKPEPAGDGEFDFGMSDSDDAPAAKSEPSENGVDSVLVAKSEPPDEFDFDFDSDSSTIPVVKQELNEDYDFGDAPGSEEPVVKTEEIEADLDVPVKKEAFATLDDLLGSMPKEKKAKDKDKKKKKKSRESQYNNDDDFDFDF